MGVCTKGVVLTDNIDIFDVVDRVEKAIHELQKTSYRGNLPKNTFTGVRGYVITSFSINDEQRHLSIFTNFPKDYSEKFGICEKIIFDLNHWGMSVEIISKILEGFLDVGKCFLLESDSNDNWVEIIKGVEQ